jgi:tetratricopeptide (TPR) repeat protein
MRVFKIIVIVLSSIILLISLSVSIIYFNQSAREKAEFWYIMKNFDRQGSVWKQWALEKSIEADPTFYKGYMEKSVAFNKRGQYSEGFKLLNKAVEIAPVENLGYRGFVKLYMLHDFNGAIEDFLRLDLLTPNVADAPWGEDIYHVIGLAYKELGELNNAKKYFNKSIVEKTKLLGEEWVDVKTFLYFGIVEYELGNYQEAIELFDKAISYSKTFTEAYYYRGLANKKINKRIESCNDLDSSYLYFNKGYYMSNPYYELPNQVYLSTLTNSMDSVCVNK